MTLVLEDSRRVRHSIDCLAGPWTYRISCASRSPLAGARSAMLHERGLIHKDIKPANILVESASSGRVADGVSASLRVCRRERQAPEPPEMIAGTLAYMAPEQTGPDEPLGRLPKATCNSLGVTFYEFVDRRVCPFNRRLTPIELIHCHIGARARTRCASLQRAVAGPTFDDRHEASREDRRGTLPDRRGKSRRISAKCLTAWEVDRPDRVVPAWSAGTRRSG